MYADVTGRQQIHIESPSVVGVIVWRMIWLFLLLARMFLSTGLLYRLCDIMMCLIHSDLSRSFDHFVTRLVIRSRFDYWDCQICRRHSTSDLIINLLATLNELLSCMNPSPNYSPVYRFPASGVSSTGKLSYYRSTVTVYSSRSSVRCKVRAQRCAF